MRCPHMAVDAFDTSGRDLLRAPSLCHHGEVEDELSECKTVFACLDYDGDGSTFKVEDDTNTAFAWGTRVEPLLG